MKEVRPSLPDLRNLRCFVALAEERHFGRAAQRLGVAQPPLSQQIRRLEALVGHALFERSNTGRSRAALTAAGQALLQPAKRALAAADMGLAAARRGGSGERGRLRVGFVASAAGPALAPLIRWYRYRVPEVEFVLHEMTTQRQWQALVQGDIDLGIAREVAAFKDMAEPMEVDCLDLLRERLVAVLPASHELASARRLRPQALKDQDFILVPRAAGHSFVDALLAVARRASFEPRVVFEATEWVTVCGLVAGGLGVSIMPESAALTGKGAVVRPLIDRQAMTTVSAWWRRDCTSATLLRLVDSMRAAQQQGGVPPTRLRRR
jgi:DNA-binding transcriptional LysR family regulator